MAVRRSIVITFTDEEAGSSLSGPQQQVGFAAELKFRQRLQDLRERFPHWAISGHVHATGAGPSVPAAATSDCHAASSGGFAGPRPPAPLTLAGGGRGLRTAVALGGSAVSAAAVPSDQHKENGHFDHGAGLKTATVAAAAEERRRIARPVTATATAAAAAAAANALYSEDATTRRVQQYVDAHVAAVPISSRLRSGSCGYGGDDLLHVTRGGDCAMGRACGGVRLRASGKESRPRRQQSPPQLPHSSESASSSVASCRTLSNSGASSSPSPSSPAPIRVTNTCGNNKRQSTKGGRLQPSRGSGGAKKKYRATNPNVDPPAEEAEEEEEAEDAATTVTRATGLGIMGAHQSTGNIRGAAPRRVRVGYVVRIAGGLCASVNNAHHHSNALVGSSVAYGADSSTPYAGREGVVVAVRNGGQRFQVALYELATDVFGAACEGAAHPFYVTNGATAEERRRAAATGSTAEGVGGEAAGLTAVVAVPQSISSPPLNGFWGGGVGNGYGNDDNCGRGAFGPTLASPAVVCTPVTDAADATDADGAAVPPNDVTTMGAPRFSADTTAVMAAEGAGANEGLVGNELTSGASHSFYQQKNRDGHHQLLRVSLPFPPSGAGALLPALPLRLGIGAGFGIRGDAEAAGGPANGTVFGGGAACRKWWCTLDEVTLIAFTVEAYAADLRGRHERFGDEAARGAMAGAALERHHRNTAAKAAAAAAKAAATLAAEVNAPRRSATKSADGIPAAARLCADTLASVAIAAGDSGGGDPSTVSSSSAASSAALTAPRSAGNNNSNGYASPLSSNGGNREGEVVERLRRENRALLKALRAAEAEIRRLRGEKDDDGNAPATPGHDTQRRSADNARSNSFTRMKQRRRATPSLTTADADRHYTEDAFGAATEAAFPTFPPLRIDGDHEGDAHAPNNDGVNAGGKGPLSPESNSLLVDSAASVSASPEDGEGDSRQTLRTLRSRRGKGQKEQTGRGVSLRTRVSDSGATSLAVRRLRSSFSLSLSLSPQPPEDDGGEEGEMGMEEGVGSESSGGRHSRSRGAGSRLSHASAITAGGRHHNAHYGTDIAYRRNSFMDAGRGSAIDEFHHNHQQQEQHPPAHPQLLPLLPALAASPDDDEDALSIGVVGAAGAGHGPNGSQLANSLDYGHQSGYYAGALLPPRASSASPPPPPISGLGGVGSLGSYGGGGGGSRPISRQSGGGRRMSELRSLAASRNSNASLRMIAAHARAAGGGDDGGEGDQNWETEEVKVEGGGAAAMHSLHHNMSTFTVESVSESFTSTPSVSPQQQTMQPMDWHARGGDAAGAKREIDRSRKHDLVTLSGDADMHASGRSLAAHPSPSAGSSQGLLHLPVKGLGLSGLSALPTSRTSIDLGPQPARARPHQSSHSHSYTPSQSQSLPANQHHHHHHQGQANDYFDNMRGSRQQDQQHFSQQPQQSPSHSHSHNAVPLSPSRRRGSLLSAIHAAAGGGGAHLHVGRSSPPPLGGAWGVARPTSALSSANNAAANSGVVDGETAVDNGSRSVSASASAALSPSHRRRSRSRIHSHIESVSASQSALGAGDRRRQQYGSNGDEWMAPAPAAHHRRSADDDFDGAAFFGGGAVGGGGGSPSALIHISDIEEEEVLDF